MSRSCCSRAVLALWLALDRRALPLASAARAGSPSPPSCSSALLIDGWRIGVAGCGDARILRALAERPSANCVISISRSPRCLRWLGAACVARAGAAGARGTRAMAERNRACRSLALLSHARAHGLAVALGLLSRARLCDVAAVATRGAAAGVGRAGWSSCSGCGRWRRIGTRRFFPMAARRRRATRSARRMCSCARWPTQMRRERRRAFLAPWWLSPALAYWSRQPGVAGSSHQACRARWKRARFFLAPDAGDS